MAPEERVAKAQEVMQSRILTQEDFKKIKLTQIAKELDPSNKAGKKRKKDASEDMDSFSKGEIVSLDDIEKIHKKSRHDKESRLATVMVSRHFLRLNVID